MIPAPQRATAPDRIPPSTLRISVGTPLARPPALPFRALQLLLRLRSGAAVGGDHRLRRSRILSTETTGRATLRRTPNAILRVDSSPSCVGRPGGSLPPPLLASLAPQRKSRQPSPPTTTAAPPTRQVRRCSCPPKCEEIVSGDGCPESAYGRHETGHARRHPREAAAPRSAALRGLDGCSTSRPPLPGDTTIRLKDTGNRRPGGRRRPGSYGVSALTPGPVEVGLLD